MEDEWPRAAVLRIASLVSSMHRAISSSFVLACSAAVSYAPSAGSYCRIANSASPRRKCALCHEGFAATQASAAASDSSARLTLRRASARLSAVGSLLSRRGEPLQSLLVEPNRTVEVTLLHCRVATLLEHLSWSSLVLGDAAAELSIGQLRHRAEPCGSTRMREEWVVLLIVDDDRLGLALESGGLGTATRDEHPAPEPSERRRRTDVAARGASDRDGALRLALGTCALTPLLARVDCTRALCRCQRTHAPTHSCVRVRSCVQPEFEMFSTRRPRNLIAGISSGAKSFIKGTLSGVVGLVAAPVVGGKDHGVPGFFAGLATGMVVQLHCP